MAQREEQQESDDGRPSPPLRSSAPRLPLLLSQLQSCLCCGLCRSLLSRPVTLPCCHHYCRRCLRERDAAAAAASGCPACGLSFLPVEAREDRQLQTLVQLFLRLRADCSAASAGDGQEAGWLHPRPVSSSSGSSGSEDDDGRGEQQLARRRRRPQQRAGSAGCPPSFAPSSPCPSPHSDRRPRLPCRLFAAEMEMRRTRAISRRQRAAEGDEQQQQQRADGLLPSGLSPPSPPPRRRLLVFSAVSREERLRLRDALARCPALREGGEEGCSIRQQLPPAASLSSPSVSCALLCPLQSDPRFPSTARLTRRTIKYLQAVAAGVAVLDTRWLSDSAQAGRWLPDAAYELQGDVNSGVTGGPQRARRQCRGGRLPSRLLRAFRLHLLLPLHADDPTRQQIEQIARTAGAEVGRPVTEDDTELPQPQPEEKRSEQDDKEERQLLVLCSPCLTVQCRLSPAPRCVSLAWLLDCIASHSLLQWQGRSMYDRQHQSAYTG